MTFVAFRGPKFRQPIHAVRVFLASFDGVPDRLATDPARCQVDVRSTSI